MKSFNVVHHDGAVRVRIEDDGSATLTVENINDSEVVVQALNRAFQSGAVRGTMFTGDCSNDQIARMHLNACGHGHNMVEWQVDAA